MCLSENDLWRINRRAGGTEPASVWRQMRWQILLVQQALAKAQGTHHFVFRLSGRDPKGHVHDQRRRVTESLATQSAENQRIISERRIYSETDVSGHAKHRQKVDDANPELGWGTECIFD
jgi:hypothetical protein